MLDIKDRPGRITKEAMRELFERAVRETPALRSNTPLAPAMVNGQFSHYMHPDTDTLWIGWALGMRCSERIQRAEAAGTKAAGTEGA